MMVCSSLEAAMEMTSVGWRQLYTASIRTAAKRLVSVLVLLTSDVSNALIVPNIRT